MIPYTLNLILIPPWLTWQQIFLSISGAKLHIILTEVQKCMHWYDYSVASPLHTEINVHIVDFYTLQTQWVEPLYLQSVKCLITRLFLNVLLHLLNTRNIPYNLRILTSFRIKFMQKKIKINKVLFTAIIFDRMDILSVYQEENLGGGCCDRERDETIIHQKKVPARNLLISNTSLCNSI